MTDNMIEISRGLLNELTTRLVEANTRIEILQADLVTPEQRAVLDAADKWRDSNEWDWPQLVAAVDALRAATS